MEWGVGMTEAEVLATNPTQQGLKLCMECTTRIRRVVLATNPTQQGLKHKVLDPNEPSVESPRD